MKAKIKILLLTLAMAVIALIAAPASAVTVFFENFESPVVIGFDDNTVPDNGNWIGSNVGFGSTNRGLYNEGDGLTWSTPYGSQVYALRYTNSGLTTAEGAIGNIQADVTYTITFDVAADQNLTQLVYNAQIITFEVGEDRADVDGGPSGTVIASSSGSAPANGSWETVSFDFSVGSGDPSVGKDLAIRFIGAISAANIDYVKVTVGGDLNPDPPIGAKVQGGDVVLSWTNLPANVGSDVWVDVWYGTDPEAMTKIVDAGLNTTSTTVNAPVADTYYWRVDSYLDGAPTGDPVEEMMFNFVVTDTDGDGLPDDYELLYTSPPSNTALDPSEDIDSDGLTTMEEYAVTKTIPNNPDTDGDTLLDGDEIDGAGLRPATDPLDPDCDDDGLTDGVETNTGTWVSSSDTGTNPMDCDYDQDGLYDGFETNTGTFVSETDAGTDPYDPDCDSDGFNDWYEVAGSYTSPLDGADKPSLPYPLPDPDGSYGNTVDPVRVYIMSGQSNMVGFGTVNGTGPGTLETITITENKFPNVIDGSDNWTVRNDVMYRGVISCIGDDYLKPQFGASSTVIGPEFGFGHVMGYYHDEPVLLIKSSIGNRSLSWDYAGPSTVQFEYGGNTYAGYGDTPASWPTGTTPDPIGWYAGYQYDQCFLDEADMAGTVPISAFNVVDILDNFASEYPQYAAQGFEIAGYAWWQGHKDQSDPHSARYEMNMVNFINDIRDYFEDRYPANTVVDAPFVLATVAFDGGWDNTSTHFLNIANGQLAVSGETGNYPAFDGNVKTVEARGYWRDGSISPTTTGYHYNHNAETYMLVGDALGRAMVDLLGADPPEPEFDPPTPDPATFAVAPAADSDTAISMTATTGTDATAPVQYYFDETSGNVGGSDSGWQTSTAYTDSGLDASTQYTYTVTMRDGWGNTTAASAPASATTDDPPPTDTDPPTPDPMTFAEFPASPTGGSTLFLEDFEAPVVSGYAEGTSPTDWVRATEGYGGTKHGLVNKDGGAFSAPAGNDQGYAFRYTNSGLTTADGVIGTLAANETYTVTFDVVRDDGQGAGLPYNVKLVAFGAGAVRNDVRTIPANCELLASTTGSASDDGLFTAISFDITVDPVANAASIGKDIGIVLYGGTTTAIVDNVQVDVGGGGATSINMMATIATDESGVEYFFTETSGNPGGSDSGWQASPSYTDLDLTTGLQYTYTVTARDLSPAQNATAASAPASAICGQEAGDPVPDVVGMTQTNAEAAILAAGFTVGTISTAYSDTVAAGNVISQNPTAGTPTAAGSPVAIEVSLGVEMVTVPDVTGMTQTAAELSIIAANLTVGAVTTATSPTVPAGDVISQNPTGGASVVHDSAVDIVVSLGVADVTVPNVVGQSQATAEANIVTATLTVGTVTTDYSDTVPVGDVISQNPSGGASVAPGTSVDLVVSLGILMVDVPNVVGLSQSAAEAAITGGILVVGNVTTAYSDTVAAGDVISQNPTGGASVVHDSVVDIVVSLGVEMVTVPNVVGLAQATAEANIVTAQLVVGTVTTAYSETVAAGDVISQNPAASSSVAIGSAVDIEVSLGAEPSGDTVNITKAEYKASKSEINVEATSSDGSSVTLTVVGYGTMTFDARKILFKYKVASVANPGATVTVTSSGGGSDTANVLQK